MDYPTSSTNVFIGNLPPEITTDKLRDMFASYGDIESAKVMMDASTSSSRGFGFVKYSDPDQASYAIQCMNNSPTSMGGKLLVKLANATEEEENQPSNNVFVKGLPFNITSEAVKSLFSPYGSITELKVLADSLTNMSRGQALIRFADVESATRAVQGLNGYRYPGTKGITVKYADNDKAKTDRRARVQRKMMTQTRYNPYGYPPSMPHSYGYRYSHMDSPYMHGPPPGYSHMYGGHDHYGGGHDHYGGGHDHYGGGNDHDSGRGGGGGGSGSSGSGSGASSSDPNNLYIYHLPPEADDSLLYKLFAPHGAIQSVKIGRDPVTDLCKGFGFVRMVNHADAWAALNAVNGMKCGSKTLTVSFKK